MPAQKRLRESAPPEEKDDEDPNLPPEPTQNTDNDENNEQDDDGEDSDESPESSGTEKDEFIVVKLSEIRKEVQCPICLGIIRKTRTVMECLHRFCRECIDKAMRLGNNECPACRTHCASRRSLRDDPNYDTLIAALYPDVERYEEEELAFHEEEKARNKQIQASIAQILQRQTEALGRKRISARTAAATSTRRSQGNYRNLRARRNQRAAELLGSDDEEDANGHEGGKDSSSGDDCSIEIKPKRGKRWAGARSSQPSAGGGDVNDSEVNKQSVGISAALIGSSLEMFSWGKGGMRSHNRHGSLTGSNGKLPRNSRLTKLMDCLRCSDGNTEGLDISLVLVSLHEEGIPRLLRPYLCCSPTLSVRHLCQYVAMQTSIQVDQIEMLVMREIESTPISSSSMGAAESLAIDPSKNKLEVLKEHQLLTEIQSMCTFSHPNLVLVYRKK